MLQQFQPGNRPRLSRIAVTEIDSQSLEIDMPHPCGSQINGQLGLTDPENPSAASERLAQPDLIVKSERGGSPKRIPWERLPFSDETRVSNVSFSRLTLQACWKIL